MTKAAYPLFMKAKNNEDTNTLIVKFTGLTTAEVISTDYPYDGVGDVLETWMPHTDTNAWEPVEDMQFEASQD